MTPDNVINKATVGLTAVATVGMVGVSYADLPIKIHPFIAISIMVFVISLGSIIACCTQDNVSAPDRIITLT